MNQNIRLVHWASLLAVLLLLAACNAELKVDTDTPGDSSGVDTSAIGDGADTVVTGGGLGDGGSADTTGGSTPGTAQSGGTPTKDTDTTKPTSTTGNIRVASPKPGDLIAAGRFTLSGESRTFENSANYRLRPSGGGALLAEGHFMATGEMGTFSPYTTTVAMTRPYTGDAVLEVFEYSAKDGSEINMVRVPLKIRAATAGQGSVSLYFTNAEKNPGAADCSKVFATTRTIASTSAIARAALEELLRGPTEAERAQSFASEIPAGTRLRDITIAGGVARADFSRELNSAAGSCRVTAVRAQIERTLRQFPSVQRVIISVEGNSEEALQP
jgi:hypothetical protein